MSDGTELKFSNESIKCGHCGNESVMYVVVDKTEPPIETEYGVTWKILRCPSCYGINIFEQDFFEIDDFDENAGNVIRYVRRQPVALYPMRRRIFKHLPKNVEKAYEVALKTYNVEPIAFAVLIGRTLEFVCRDRNAKGKDLNAMLKDLAAKDEIPKVIADMAHGLRFFRNISAHAFEMEVSQEDAAVLRDLCEVILEYIYEAPSMIKQLEDRISQLKATNNSVPSSP